ncbi:MAG: M23 family metallopeptidase [Anaerolineaceae bacterium]|nr:M23 family metallopeptidase [Anaerolineaceae bacterium]
MNGTKIDFKNILAWTPAVILLVLVLTLWSMVFSGDLSGEFAWYTLQLLIPLLGIIYLIVVGIKIIRKRSFTRRLTIILLLSLLAILPAMSMIVPIAYPYSLGKAQPVATVRLPANEPLLVIWGGDTYDKNYHVVSPDQRWAYDFVVEPALSGSTALEDYGCYGIPVVAPIDGEITLVHDGEPDEVPGTASNNVEHPRGNFVVIKMATNTYLLIAHMIPGSIEVSEGEMVKEGQVIGACGNSGNTSEPHIHIHQQRIDPGEWPNGFGEGLPLYFRDHDGPAMPEGGFKIVDETPQPLGPIVQHQEQ